MKFLAMLFAILIHWSAIPLKFSWPARWKPAPVTGPWLWIFACGPALGAALLLGLAGSWLWGFLGLMVQLLVLLGCLGGSDWRRLFDHLAAAGEHGDLQAALHRLDELSGAVAVADDAALPQAMAETLALHFVREWFGPLFWFALLGAPGALLYRCLERIAATSGRGRALLTLLDWPALGAFGLATAVAGCSGRAFGVWAATLFAAASPAQRAGAHAAAALDDLPADLPAGVALASRVRMLEALFKRTLLAWLALVAVVWILL